MKFVVVPFSLCVAFQMLAGCSGTDAVSAAECGADADCAAGEACDLTTGRCLPRQSGEVPSLEIWPPSLNNQGWVVQEVPVPNIGPDGQVLVKLQQAVSVKGRVFASHDPALAVPAQIVAWRESLIEGRPKVQVETLAQSGKRDSLSDTYVLWLNKGFSYTFAVTPLPPYDSEYPPQTVSGVQVLETMKLDFVLDGQDRAVVVKGRIRDYAGDLLSSKVTDAEGTLLGAAVRVRAFETGGDKRSTIGKTNPETGEFEIKVPAGVSAYTMKVETLADNMPIPTLECGEIVLGIATSSQTSELPVQDIADVNLPSFRFPKLYRVKVRDSEGGAVAGAVVTFSTAVTVLVKNAGFEGCEAFYRRSGLTDAEGELDLLLIPGSSTANQEYAVTIKSPPNSEFASAWIDAFEVGPNPGLLGDIVLARRYMLRGKVVTKAEGGGVGGVQIEAIGIGSGSTTSNLPVTTANATTNEEGRFELFVDPGTYNLEFNPPAGEGLPIFGRTTKVENDVSGVLFEVPLSRVLTGKVFDPNENALAGAKVQVYSLAPKMEKPVSYTAVLRGSAISAETGSFSLVLADLPVD